MQEIKCPNCGQVFQVDESGYAQILQQVRDKEFDKELARREQEIAQQKDNDLKIARMQQTQDFEAELAKVRNQLAGKTLEIEQLKAQIGKAETEKKLAVAEAVQEKDRELSDKGAEITRLQNDLVLQQKESALKETNLLEKHRDELKLREEEIERLKDFKARQSTKMVGESLEQHCLNEFNRIRMTAFPNAYFEKDNDARTGSKGDFIFRESADGTEFISIMFEMKNESPDTQAKHKNEDFFKELDKDRREKKCEYAVLVSLLESDSELYNNGIVDVSYRYTKMFVVRPQFFIPIISLLRNAALNSLEYQTKLAQVQNQQLDLYHFEENLAQFKNSFADSFRKASDRFEDAIKGIDNTIASLTKIRENLVKSENHLNTANNKLEDVSIKKLTKNAPSVRAMFEQQKAEEQDG
ncbi:MAG: DUF2130 domain-containing protein [Lachnospiraceae bacterium]|nr:DUF2130 domain-containing protein [Lachnospiraceae bacterium]